MEENAQDFWQTLNLVVDFIYGLDILFGLVFNFFVIAVCFRATKLRQIATFTFIGFVAISSSLSLFGAPLNSFILQFFEFNPRLESPLWCQISFYITMITRNYNVWLTVYLLIIDNYIKSWSQIIWGQFT